MLGWHSTRNATFLIMQSASERANRAALLGHSSVRDGLKQDGFGKPHNRSRLPCTNMVRTTTGEVTLISTDTASACWTGMCVLFFLLVLVDVGDLL